jgi:transcription termination/antitermination protein NusG
MFSEQMGSETSHSAPALPGLPAEYSDTRWYAVYTNPRHEKRVEQQGCQRGFECFLPVYKSVRRWKDRRKELELPLFPGYVFVHLALKDRLRILQLPGVIEFVSCGARPAALPESEIEALRNGLHYACAHPYSYLRLGRRVRVHSGPVAGLEGILIRKKNKWRVVVSIELIHRSIAVEVDEDAIEPIQR